MFRARRPIPAPFKAPSSAYTTSPPSCQGLALASTSCGEKAHPETQDRALFFCDLRVCACKLVDARPKAWHDDWDAEGAEPLLRPLNLTPMGPSPGIHELSRKLFTRRRGDAEQHLSSASPRLRVPLLAQRASLPAP